MAIHGRRHKARAARAKAELAVQRGQSGVVTSEKDTVPRNANDTDLEAQMATGHANGKSVAARHTRGMSEQTAGTTFSGETTKPTTPPVTPGV